VTEEKKLWRMRFELIFVSDGLNLMWMTRVWSFEGQQLQWKPASSYNLVRALGDFVLPAKSCAFVPSYMYRILHRFAEEAII